MAELRQALLAKADHELLQAERQKREGQQQIHRTRGGHWVTEIVDIDDPDDD